MKKKKICITGVVGFIGFHLACTLLKDGYAVVGVDSVESYYDVRIKHRRLAMLKKYPSFTFYKASIANYPKLESILKKEKPQEIVHLAAQAGVRYSLKNAWAYAESNYVGTLNVFEAAKRLKTTRVIYASSSSVYGSNTKSPFSESDCTDRQISLYAATKKANESLAFAYNHLFGIEMIGLRFFTVYGPWGRPDMALFKFVRAIVEKKPIELYNGGNMKRSFTHVSDIVSGIEAVLKQKPTGRCAIYNLGGGEAVPLTKFVELIEKNLHATAKKKMLPMQAGDVSETLADISLAKKDLNYSPKISVEEGIESFTKWFLENKKFLLSLSEPKQ